MQKLLEKAKTIRLLALDVDGVFSDGKLYFGNNGEELKSFSTFDGLGIKQLQKTGITVAIITGRSSTIVANRAKELGIRHVYQGRDDKQQALQELAEDLNIPLDAVAYVGDDLPDLGAIMVAGLGLTVANGHHYVVKHADGQTRAAGGEGAVREVCELIMEAQGSLNAILESYQAK